MTAFGDLRRWIETESRALRDLAAANPDVAVPACPGWDVQALLEHLGGAHRWVGQIVGAGAAGDASPHERVLPAAPPALDEALRWFDESVATVLDAFDRCDPAAPVWTPVPAGGLGGRQWWVRKEALESAIHRHDGADAVAAVSSVEVVPIAPGLAAAGIDEHLDGFAPGLSLMAADRLPPVVLHLHATDVPAGGWWLDLGGGTAGPATAQRGSPPASEAGRSSTLTGTASDLLLWLWNRHPDPNSLVTAGDRTIATAWRALAI